MQAFPDENQQVRHVFLPQFPQTWKSILSSCNVLNQGCNSAIIACGRGGQWEIAISLLWTMLSRLCAVDIYTGYSTVWACETAGKWELALKVLKLIPETRVRMPTRLELFEFKMYPQTSLFEF